MAASRSKQADIKWRKSLDIGSECEYKSKSENKWVSAIVSDVFRDKRSKEWLRLNYGNPLKRKELKRFAKSFRPITKKKPSKQSNEKRALETEDVIEMQPKKRRKLNENVQSSQTSDIGKNKKMDQEKPFKCKEKGCNKSFATKSYLIKHGAVHSKKRPFGCQQCGEKFKQQGHLYHHIKRIHEKVIRHRCEWEGCEKGFYFKGIHRTDSSLNPIS